MMSKYKFETDEFGLSDNGIHLLRSRYNYETIPFEQVHKLRFERSKIVNRWLLLFVIGLASIVFAFYYTLALLDVFNDDLIHRIYIEELLFPFFALCIGTFMVYSSLRSGLIMIVSYGNKIKRLPLEQLKKSGQLYDFTEEVESVIKREGKSFELAAIAKKAVITNGFLVSVLYRI